MFGIGKKEDKEPDFKFELGTTARDKITGFEGLVTARSQWLNNCNTYRVQPRKLIDGKIQEAGHFDEPQLELVPDEPTIEARRTTGGPERPVCQTNR